MTETPGITGHWDIDPSHSRLGFSTRHAMVSRVRGAFNDVSGFADIAEDLANSKAEVIIQTASVDTRTEARDEHLRSADFFDVETYPEIRFVSSAIDEVDESSYIVTGELTIRDMAKTVSVPLELIGIETDPDGNLRAGLEGSRRIDRKDWGVTWNTKLDSGGVLVSDKITLEFELSLIKNLAEAAPADSSETAVQDDAPTETPEPVTEATPAPEADTAAPQEAAPTPEAPESVPPTPVADETAPPTPKAPESAASVAPAAEPVGKEFPPPPPVKPAETPADKPAEKAPEPKQSDAQSSGSAFGKLFGLR
ncbi:Polyisoprenoid-binding protein YceI [Brevibacterium siliguriense]|uniref:Polyisoprenoid-binding protein YceI n=1 Tax=Brevibacterium siliguriense TaxID=1136497 RepID=A0A1H1Y9E5_9MICO|nr:Polyisoprenoid-binding protein YceI [Brevibacterium siliguriense]